MLASARVVLLLLAPALAQPAAAGMSFPDASLLPVVNQGGPGPRFAQTWTARGVMSSAASSLGAQVGTFWHDGPKQRWRFKACSSTPIFHPDDQVCMDQLSKNVSGPMGENLNYTIGTGSDQVCKAMPGAYYDIFAGMPGATRKGSGEVAGEPCVIWALSIQSPAYNVSFSACVASDGVPRQFNFTTGLAYHAASAQYWTFSNVSVGPVADAVFAPSEVCSKRYPMPPCPSAGVEPLDLYRVRTSDEPDSLANRNLGDALGDMAFFCDLAGVGEAKLVTRWAVQANSSWGQYAYCLYAGGRNVCFGNTGKSVGRESALGLGKGAVQGQCSPNQDVGSWFSMPAEGECRDGAPIGSEGCTWSAKPIRSVSASCILHDRGLKESCARERGHAPMLDSAAIFKAALATSDPGQGGCPDAAREATADVVVV